MAQPEHQKGHETPHGSPADAPLASKGLVFGPFPARDTQPFGRNCARSTFSLRAFKRETIRGLRGSQRLSETVTRLSR